MKRKPSFYDGPRAAEALGITKQRVYQLVAEGKLKTANVAGTAVIISRREIERRLQEQGGGLVDCAEVAVRRSGAARCILDDPDPADED